MKTIPHGTQNVKTFISKLTLSLIIVHLIGGVPIGAGLAGGTIRNASIMLHYAHAGGTIRNASAMVLRYGYDTVLELGVSLLNGIRIIPEIILTSSSIR